MEIPERISDMDSLPTSLSSRTSPEAGFAMAQATVEDAITKWQEFGRTMAQLNTALVNFGLAAFIDPR